MEQSAYLSTSIWTRLGRAWFQYRSFSPIPLFLLVLVLPPNFELSLLAKILVGTLMIFGEFLRIWGVAYAGSVTRTRGDAMNSLVHSGPFRFVRNPLYIGNLLLYVGCAVFFGFSYLSLFMFVYFALQYSLIVSYEEENLKKHFGTTYEDYQRKVPRWFFRLNPGIYPSVHECNWRAALRSERTTLILIFCMMVLYGVKSQF